MNRFTISGVNEELVRPMHCFLDALISENVIPITVKRIALNIRSKDMNSRFQPIEIQLERASSQAPWQLRFIATFDVMVTGTPQKELSLYFNFAGCWFYHPEIKQCNLQRPEVQTLLASWLKAITHTLITQPAISINITSVRSLILTYFKEVSMNQAANLAMFACKRAKPSHQLIELVKRSMDDVKYRGKMTIRFQNPSYHPKDSGFHPVSITVDVKDSHIALIEITDLVYVGTGTPELVPDLAFDFANNVAFARFRGWLGMYLQETTELYEMWECNFLAYVEMNAYDQVQVKYS